MIILVLIYLLGSWLAVGRGIASYYESYKGGRFFHKPGATDLRDLIIVDLVLSWISLAVGLVIYFEYKEEILFKWNLKDLEE